MPHRPQPLRREWHDDAVNKDRTDLLGRIPVVDDDHTVRDVLTRYLNRAGHLMPLGVPGAEVCRRIPAAGPTPVIMTTAPGAESYAGAARSRDHSGQ